MSHRKPSGYCIILVNIISIVTVGFVQIIIIYSSCVRSTNWKSPLSHKAEDCPLEIIIIRIIIFRAALNIKGTITRVHVLYAYKICSRFAITR